ncbi:MAG: hypothetical protein WKF63_08275 [Thermomicrobiales bacterium]
MDFFEDLGGCAMIGIVAGILLLLVICVAVLILGGVLPDLIG